MTASSIQLCNNDPLPSWPYTYFLLWDTRAMVCSPGPHCWLSKALKCPYSQVLAVRKIHFWITFFLLLNHYNFVIFKDDSNYRQVFFPWTLLKEVIFFWQPLSLFQSMSQSPSSENFGIHPAAPWRKPVLLPAGVCPGSFHVYCITSSRRTPLGHCSH